MTEVKYLSQIEAMGRKAVQQSLDLQEVSDYYYGNLIESRPPFLLTRIINLNSPSRAAFSHSNHKNPLLAAPDNTVLIHACNTKGSWGAGIAVAFKTFCPHAYEVYHTHCLSTPVQTGTCLLIPPCESDAGPKHWIACLFTSAAYGKKKDAPEEILRNTETAVRDLLVQVQLARGRDEMIAGLRMCRINSGRFGVEWERTEAVLRGMKIDGPGGGEIEIEVWDRGEEDL